MRLLLVGLVALAVVSAQNVPSTGDELVSTVVEKCVHMDCVKENVLSYLDTKLKLDSDARSIKNIDGAIFKRAARILQTHEFKLAVPTIGDLVYNPNEGLDIVTPEDESRGLLKKKLLLPILLLLKLKMKALAPILMFGASIKALKALIISKLALGIVLGFVIYQLCAKAGMPMPITMAPVEPPPPPPPPPMYGPPSTPPPNSYEPSWEPNQGGPYSRIWSAASSNQEEPQRLAYSAYYSGSAGSSSTSRP